MICLQTHLSFDHFFVPFGSALLLSRDVPQITQLPIIHGSSASMTFNSFCVSRGQVLVLGKFPVQMNPRCTVELEVLNTCANAHVRISKYLESVLDSPTESRAATLFRSQF